MQTSCAQVFSFPNTRSFVVFVPLRIRAIQVHLCMYTSRAENDCGPRSYMPIGKEDPQVINNPPNVQSGIVTLMCKIHREYNEMDISIFRMIMFPKSATKSSSSKKIVFVASEVKRAIIYENASSCPTIISSFASRCESLLVSAPWSPSHRLTVASFRPSKLRLVEKKNQFVWLALRNVFLEIIFKALARNMT